MVTIIKNQLLKHLSRYTKNLSPEQINLSALRGSGELQDLTLDEDLLTDLLELPGWVRLTSAKCNKATFRIQWTKLKTVPIVLNLDEVHIALEVCEEPRTMNPSAASAMPIPGKYSYIHKVIDGISVAVNQVQIDFNCDAFTSSVQISRVTVESRTPDGRKGDLRLTRMKSPDTGQLLIFKELEWQSARVEAKPHGVADAGLPPLRLLLGNTHCRIVIKKRLADCSVVGSRLVLRPEPVAWALTDGQLRAALACAAALAQPVRRATAAATRAKALRKIEEPREQIQSRPPTGDRDLLARMFAKHDVRETSYHLLAPRIDLHLCDDPGLGRSEKPSLSNGGALQVTLVSMQADLFPYHKASNDRRHWRGYRETATPHSQWLSQALSSFCGTLLESLDPRPIVPSNKQARQSDKPEEPVSNGISPKPAATQNSASNAPSTNSTTSQASPTRTRILEQLGKLMTTCLVLRIDDFTVNKVSTGFRSREAPRPLVAAEKATLPGDAGLLHAEFTFFYYPGDVCFPVPAPKLYVQVSPVRVSVDAGSVVWLAAFAPHVGRALLTDGLVPPPASGPASGPAPVGPYLDVRMEAIMPKLVLEAGSEHVPAQRDRPRELHLCTARATLTNVRDSPRANTAGTRADLASILAALRRAAPPRGQFPASADDLDPIHDQFVLHADNLDDIDRGSAISSEMLWRENRAVWCVRVEPMWADFCGARATNYKPAPLLDATPLTAWMCFEEGFSRIYVVARTCGLAGLQLNHYQMLFLMRQLERISEMMSWLAHDAARQPDADAGSIVVGVVVPAVELTLVLPSNCPGQESSRDLDSVPLDSSSLQDMKMGSEATMAPSVIDRDSGVLATTSVEVFSAQPLPAEEMPPPSPGLNFAGLSSMRRGLTSLVSSLDGALRDDARSDAASTASSDEERYVLVGLAAESPDDADVAFREFEQGRGGASSGVEVAAEVVERSSSPSDHSLTSSCRRRDLISTCTWRLNNIHVVHQSVNGKSCMRLAADDLRTDECSSIPWDEFQHKFAMRARAFSEPRESADPCEEPAPRDAPRIAARLLRTELPRQLDHKGEPTGLAPFEELLEARVRDLSIALNMSTALALAEFIEDEVIVPPMPLEVLIDNVKLHLIEDRLTRSISSPPPQPLDIDLTTLRLTRDNAGVVRLGPPISTPSTIASPATPQPQPELDEAREKIDRLSRENEELRKRLGTLARIAEDNRELRAKLEEASMLRSCVHAAQQEAASLLADKQQLLDAMRVMQEQLSGCRGKR
ncbi:bridge-like lipid transfer protein family member 3B [Achroia grisella]|uniref:bridge-like lipid transfer protein family member 3B n=1 Tax=Achroia grisella TaxID=688607 RepID=UPI0027D2F71C|nr:bridge-like lipid transfer protein family member 3B [Achroia grisella]